MATPVAPSNPPTPSTAQKATPLHPVYSPREVREACIPASWLRGLNWLLVTLAGIVLLDAAMQYHRIRAGTDPDLMDERRRIIGAAMSAAAVFLFPMVWSNIIGFSLLTRSPFTIIGFGWPLLLNLIDLYYSSAVAQRPKPGDALGLGSITSDTSTILSLTFSVGLLLTSLGGGQRSSASVNLLFYALLLLAAFAIPLPTLDPQSMAAFAVTSGQRIAINYALGVILSAIALNVSPSSGESLRAAFLSACGPSTQSPVNCTNCT